VQSLFFRVIKIKAKGNKRGSARRVLLYLLRQKWYREDRDVSPMDFSENLYTIGIYDFISSI